MYGYEISLLFLLFLAINLIWEVFLGSLVFINDVLGGRKSMWLSRTKEELLGLGVASLVLSFIEPQLASVCLDASDTNKSDSSPGPANGDKDVSTLPIRHLLGAANYDACPSGQTPLFTAEIVQSSKYL